MSKKISFRIPMHRTRKFVKSDYTEVKYLRSVNLSSKMYREIDEVILELNDLGFNIDTWSEGMRLIISEGIKSLKKTIAEKKATTPSIVLKKRDVRPFRRSISRVKKERWVPPNEVMREE